MNLQSDAIVGNQGDHDSIERFEWRGHRVTYLNFDERGVGLNRNNTLMRADGDILLLADDDLVYQPGYVAMVQKAFETHPKADAIIFNIETKGADVGRRINRKAKRVHWYNALNYGAVRIAVRRKRLLCHRITFSQCFGGGTLYSSGEDSLLICDMLKKGMKLYTSPEFIASVDQTSSTWFCGYNEKYLYDKGALFKAAFGAWAGLMCLQELIRHRGLYRDLPMSFGQKYRLMKKGMRSYKTLTPWQEFHQTATEETT